MAFSERVRHLKAEGAYRVLGRAQELEADGRDIIHLEIGEPDFPTPAHIRRAGIQAITDGRTRYNPPRGIGELRESIAQDAGRRRGVAISPSQVVISPGAKPNLFFPTLALVEPGDEVLYPDPGFPTYEAMIRVAGGLPVPVPLAEAKGFSFDLEAFDRLVSEKTRLIILNSPCNPTGSIMPLEDLRHIASAAQRYDCWVLSDEIYYRIVFDGLDVHSIYTLPGMAERTVIMDGFSKTYAMTGWRLGYGIMPEELAERVDLLLMHSVGCTAHFTQYAGLEAIRASQHEVAEMVAAYQDRRDVLVAGLNSLPGVTCLKPQGAIYAFPNITALGRPSEQLANLILDRANVALLPGTAFGRHGEGYLRVVFANSVENIRRALGRI
ncbi:MAG: pyridoxal phosphate-dependent aminotransferase, partial [Chloroflexi bacterium]|nr:pyridoxal phosphate-dependent aminotransferase [Chloroflexota bacterium]